MAYSTAALAQAATPPNLFTNAYLRAKLFGGSPVAINKIPDLPYSPTGLQFGTPQGAPASEKNITVGLQNGKKQQFYNIPSLVPANTLGPTYDRSGLVNLLGGAKPNRGQVKNAIGYANSNGLLSSGKGFSNEQAAIAAELSRHQLIDQTYQQRNGK